MSQHDAEENAIRRFGPAAQLAREVAVFSLPLKALLAVASMATIVVALGLLTLITSVLPARDPDRIPLWTGVAIGFLIYSGLCIAYLVIGPRHAALRTLVLLLSVTAIGLGAYGVIQMIQAATVGQHFEGYLLLMGIVLASHGVVAFIYTAMSAAIARRVMAH
jgi:hypothetical protein